LAAELDDEAARLWQSPVEVLQTRTKRYHPNFK